MVYGNCDNLFILDVFSYYGISRRYRLKSWVDVLERIFDDILFNMEWRGFLIKNIEVRKEFFKIIIFFFGFYIYVNLNLYIFLLRNCKIYEVVFLYVW